MTMQTHDDQFEKYLAEFQPRAVNPLHSTRQASTFWRRLAAAAVVVCCVGAGVKQIMRVRLTSRAIPLKSQTFLLTKIGLHDPKMLDEFLNDQSRNVLPNLQGERSTLQVLARE